MTIVEIENLMGLPRSQVQKFIRITKVENSIIAEAEAVNIQVLFQQLKDFDEDMNIREKQI